MTSFLAAAADLLFGATCAGCAVPAFGICMQCRDSLQHPPRLVERGLRVPLVAAGPYRPLLAHIIPRYKDDGALHLEKFLGLLLARAVAALDPPRDATLVPIPSLRAAVRRRGYDHARRLASVAARRCGVRQDSLLKRGAQGTDQEGLTKQQRRTNLANSMAARCTQSPVIVVDDVVTTGSSLGEAIRALQSVGVRVVGAAVVAEADN